MNNKRKRFLSALLSFSLVLGLLPQCTIVSHASGAVSYNPSTTDYAILNQYNYQNKNYYTYYVKRTELYNAVSKFSGLSAGKTYNGLNQTFSWNNFVVSSDPLSAYGSIAAADQLQINLSATIHNVKHRHGNIFVGGDALTYQYAYIQSGPKRQIVNGYDFSTSGTATMRLGDMEFTSISNYDTITLTAGIGHNYINCSHTDCSIGDIAVAFADITDPRVKGAYTCDADGNVNNKVKAGAPIYLKVEFSEPIRFADNNASDHSGIKAKMQDSTANTLTGNLVALKDNYLLFEFDNTSVFEPSSQNISMTSVDLSDLFGSGNGSWSFSQVQKGISINNKIDTANFKGQGYTTSDSLITDIAGNPLRKPSSNSTAALSSAFYVDGEAPYVSSITKTAQMNNGDVKTELGKTDTSVSGYLDTSDTHAGVGDKVIFTANFNEKLNVNGNCYNSNYFLGMLATLNVKSSNGSYVQVRSATMSQISGGTDLKNGASQGSITSVGFSPFTVTEGMTCDDPDGNIKITSITPYSGSVILTDLCGNTYDDAGNKWSTLNNNSYIFDVTAPTVTTSAGQSGSSYSPAAVTMSGTSITEFYFPVSITDTTGTDGIRGSFSWNNGVSGAKDFKYEYAVTANTAQPDNSVWQLGTTGQAYSFTQVSAGNYIHIRLIDGELYNLGATTLSFKSKDYAGNTGAASFALDYSADRVAPSAAVTSTGKSYNSSTGLGTFAVSAEVKDDGGLNSVYYSWVMDGSGAPAAESSVWKVTGSFANGATSATVETDYDGINGAFTGKLYIKAIDISGNISVTDLGSYTYDISAPAHTLTYTEERKTKASLTLSDLASESAAVVMIKKPGSSDNTYYVSVVDSAAHWGNIFNNKSVGVQMISDVYSWQTYTVTTTGGAFGFTFRNAPDSMLNKILDGSYYGEIEVTVLTGRASIPSSTFNFSMLGTVSDDAFIYSIAMLTNGSLRTTLTSAGTDTYPVYAESIILKAAPGYDAVYSAAITTSDVTDNRVTVNNSGHLLNSYLGFDPDNSSGNMLPTLEGLTFNISLANNLVSEWGVDDVDFSNTYISIYRTNDGKGNFVNTQVGDKLCLTPQATQSITLPANDYPSGTYSLVLTVTSMTSGTAYTFQYPGNIYVDAAEASNNFGFAGYFSCVHDAHYGLIDKESYVYYGPVYGWKDADGKALTQYTAGEGTIYIPVNSNVGSYGLLPRLYFTADDVSVDGNGAYYGVKAMKAWNVSSGVDSAQSKASSAWYEATDGTDDSSSQNSFYFAKYVDSASEVLSAYGTASDTGYLPLIKNTLNTIAFQVVNANGKASEVRYAYIYPMDVSISGTVSLSNPGQFVKEGTLSFKPAEGQSMNGASLFVYDYQTSTLNDITASYDLATNSYSMALTQSGQHFYYVYTLDDYGNYTLFDIPKSDTDDGNHFWALTDSGAPSVISSSCTNIFDGKFSATYVFSEDTIMSKKAQTLNVYFDQEYMNMLGLNSSASVGKGFSLNLPAKDGSGTQTVFMASKSNPYGIYKVEMQPISNQDKRIMVTIYGVVKYTESVADNSLVSHTLYATLEDPFGNVSDPGTGVEVKVRNTKPAYNYGSYDVYSTGGGSTSYRGLTAVFNTPVMLDKSIGTNAPSSYSLTKTSELPIFGDGTYNISFYDIFGTKWMQEITLTDVFREYSLQVALSEPDSTSGPVTVTITTDHPDTTSFSVYDSTNGAWTALTGNNMTSATFDVSENKEMHIVLRNSNEGNSRVDEMLYMNNIITGAPKAIVQWYYSEFMSDTPPDGVTGTTKAVTAWYTADRDVTPSGGTASSFTFYPGDTTKSYTFEYTDRAGNKGSVTATLPIALTVPSQPEPDITKPEYTIDIYGMSDGVYRPAGYYSSTNLTDTVDSAISAAGYVQSYYFNINVTEESAYKFVLLSGANADTSGVTYAGSSPDTVDGVTLSGRTIAVTKAAAYTVAIVDKANNKSSFSMDLGKYIDNIAPTVQVNKDYKSFYSVRTYIELSDTGNTGMDTGKVTLLSPMGLPVETDSNSPYNGQYYYDFNDNKSQTITYRDGAGNIGSMTITIDSLDLTAPTASIVWSPYYYDSDSGASGDSSVPPNYMTNKDVTATVTYSKSIDTVLQSISFDGGSSWTQVTDETFNNIFTLKMTSDTASVTFHKGGFAIRLIAAALNGKTVTNTLYLDDVIYKAAPTVKKEVSYNYNAGFETGTPYSATITLTPLDTDVYCADTTTPGKLINKNSSTSFTVYNKGDYTYHFTDTAGNASALTVLVDKEMDRTPPDVSVNTGDGTITNGNVTVSISMDEEGTLVVTGANKTVIFSGEVSKNAVKQLTIANNGSYGVTAYDTAGNKTASAFMVGSIDKTDPAITLDPVTVSIKQDSNADDLKALLDAGCTVTDNVSDRSAITVTYNTTGVILTTPGVYKVPYTVQDEAGNTSTTSRFVRVYSKDELDVLLNGKKTSSGGTTTLTFNTITISVQNPLGDEPYTIYLSRGIKTEGQMKKDYTIIKPDATGSFTVSSDGFYTLYIVTQSRQTYLTKIYIDQ